MSEPGSLQQADLLKGKRTIPEISEDRLKELVSQIKPVVRKEYDPLGGFARPKVDWRGQTSTFLEIELPHLRNTAYTWDPKTVGDPLNLILVGEDVSFHDWGYYGMFKPSIAEVLACIQDRIPKGVTHFWLDKDSVQKEGQPLLHEPDEKNISGYHRAEIYLFRRVA